ncbi:unnamed protein product, partial [Meganyctiphanes norvegica]
APQTDQRLLVTVKTQTVPEECDLSSTNSSKDSSQTNSVNEDEFRVSSQTSITIGQSSQSTTTTISSTNYGDLSDTTYIPPSNDEDEEENEYEISEDEENCDEDLNDSDASADKFIVCEEQLLELFQNCPSCAESADSLITKREGTLIEIYQKCLKCSFNRRWKNQTLLHQNMPHLNLMISGAIHISGCVSSQALRMFHLIGLQVIKPVTFYNHQTKYIIPTVLVAWEEEQEKNVQRLKDLGDGLILSGDCRFDSPGHCAKYGSYTLIEDRINKVIDLQLVQSSEVPNSSWCELEGLRRSIQLLVNVNNLSISAIITDRHAQVAKYIRELLVPRGTKHYYDGWHLAKNIVKRLDAAAKEPGCEEIAMWKQSIVNHLYWTAGSTPDGNPQLMRAKWISLCNHVQDIHVHTSKLFPKHDITLFPQCLHQPLEGEERNKQWIEPGSVAAVKLEAIMSQTRFLNDVGNMSPKYQTSSLESFHALVLRFALKLTGFSYNGMKSRLYLAALHYNHNADRGQASTKEGELRFSVKYPRFKKGAYSVHPIKKNASYTYATDLLKKLKEGYEKGPKELVTSKKEVMDNIPAPLSCLCDKPEKHMAVKEHLSRIAKFKTEKE